MHRSTATHGLWLLVALGTFFIGRHFAASPGPAADNPSGGGAGGGRIESTSKSLAEQKRARLAGSGGAGGGDLPGTAREPGASRASLTGEAAIDRTVRTALRDPNPVKRSLAFARLLESVSSDNAIMVQASLKENGANGEQWGLFNYAWGAADPDGALARLPDIEERHRDGFLNQLIPGWASTDPGGAIKYVEAMEPGKGRDRMTGSLVGGLADNDIDTATDYVFQLSQGGDKNAARYIESVAGEVLRNGGPEEGATWADRLEEGDVKAAALARVAGRFVDKDPKAAARWVEQYADDDSAARAIEEVGDEWAERDPSSAVEWLGSLPEGKGKAEGMSSALGEWARRDPTAASQYLAEMPSGGTRDAAIAGFASRLAWEQPREALAWAETITSSSARIDAITRAGQAWARRDAAAAAAWVVDAGLPANVQETIVNPPKRRR
jgi:hypothetical protein